MSEKCKHGIRDIATNLPYCRRCDEARTKRSVIEVMTLEECINEAAKELPEDWIIEINIEQGAASVYLYDGFGNMALSPDSSTLSEQVMEAIKYAKEKH